MNRHEWTEGARLPTGIDLATCGLCGTLRATGVGEPSSLYFFRRREEEDERVRKVEPACVAPTARFRKPW